jgi:DNA-binding PadR family transcriptional regulator
VVLGLLVDGPASGWDLAQKADRSIGHFWPITRAHIYAELPKLAERGWATAEEVPQVGVPTKRVYTATGQGRAAFTRWLAEVELTEERGRQPLQLQLFFATHAAPERLEQLLDAWEQRAGAVEEHCRAILAAKGVRVDALPPLGRSVAADRASASPLAGLDLRGMTALFGLRRAQADRYWLEEVRRALRAEPAPSGPAGRERTS